MKTAEQIKEEIKDLKEELPYADTRYDWTRQEVIQEIINKLEWVLK